MPRRRRVARYGILPPQLALQGTVSDFQAAPLQDGATYTQITLSSHNFSDQEADDVLLEHVHFKHVDLARTNLTAAQLVDVRLETCDLAGSEWKKAHLQRVECLGCRLVGAKLIEGQFDNIFFKDCNGEFALFWEASFKSTRFDHCGLREASFEGANVSGVVFRNCDLRKADFRNAKLAGTDFRGSAIEGMQVGIKELQGAIIDPTQAVHLATLLGITVKDLDD